MGMTNKADYQPYIKYGLLKKRSRLMLLMLFASSQMYHKNSGGEEGIFSNIPHCNRISKRAAKHQTELNKKKQLHICFISQSALNEQKHSMVL